MKHFLVKQIQRKIRNAATAFAVAAALTIYVSPEKANVYEKNGDHRKAKNGRSICRSNIKHTKVGSGRYGSVLDIELETDDQIIVKFRYVEELQDKHHENSVLKTGDDITLKVKEGEDFYYQGWGGQDFDVEHPTGGFRSNYFGLKNPD